MQFTKIRLAGRTNIDLVFFGLRPANTYKLKAVDGLGPPEVDVRIQDNLYLGRQPQDREIVLRVGLTPNDAIGQTVASMRTTLYGLLTPRPTDYIVVQMMNGPTVVAQVTGYVKKLEPVIFTKDPEVQITIACLGEYLSAPAIDTVTPVNKNAFILTNTGSVSTGFYTELTFTANRDNFSMFSEAADDNDGPRLRIDYPFLTGDMLKIDTRKGLKSVKVNRDGVLTNIIRGLSSDSLWFELHPGDNTFWVTPVTFTWERVFYVPQYWGV